MHSRLPADLLLVTPALMQLRIQGAAIARPLPSADHGPPVTDPTTAQITALNALGRSEARRLLEVCEPIAAPCRKY